MCPRTESSMRKFYRAWCILATLFPALSGSTATQQVLGDVGQCDRPNVVFILTDDQDAHLGSLEYMPFVRKHLLNEGTYFNKHYCTTAVCCPSRVTLWTGKASHNTNITDVNPPYGQSMLLFLFIILTFLCRRVS